MAGLVPVPPAAQGRAAMARQGGQLCSPARQVSAAPTHLHYMKLGQLYLSLFTDRFKHLNTLLLSH